LKSAKPAASIKVVDEKDENSIFNDESEWVSSVISSTKKGSSLASVGMSYYSYISNMERRFKEEKEVRKKLEQEIERLKKQNAAISVITKSEVEN